MFITPDLPQGAFRASSSHACDLWPRLLFVLLSAMRRASAEPSLLLASAVAAYSRSDSLLLKWVCVRECVSWWYLRGCYWSGSTSVQVFFTQGHVALFVVLEIKAKNLQADILQSKDLIVTTMQSCSLAGIIVWVHIRNQYFKYTGIGDVSLAGGWLTWSIYSSGNFWR